MDEIKPFETGLNSSDYTILVVDDVVANVLLLKTLLKNEKYNVLTASDGRACLNVCKEQHPDLVLLDVMMPVLDGWSTATIMKKDPELKDIPIIFLTAFNTPADLVKGFQVGGNDFLGKPFSKEELLMRISHQLSLVAAKRIIVKQNEELRHTINNRDKMYSVIAHDLRSPMASIRMVLGLVVQSITPESIGPELYNLLDQANKEAEETHDLLDNLLKWTKSQTGRLTVAYQNFEICDVIIGVVDIFRMVAETKKITLNYTQGEKRHKVRADKDMLNTVVRNFMSNAIKFSNEGSSIDILVSEQEQFVKVSVRDHGVGISPDRVKTIFHSGSTTYGTNNEEGSGLGLQLCQDFAIKNGGNVEVESVEGEGSTFSVLIPMLNEENKEQ